MDDLENGITKEQYEAIQKGAMSGMLKTPSDNLFTDISENVHNALRVFNGNASAIKQQVTVEQASLNHVLDSAIASLPPSIVKFKR